MNFDTEDIEMGLEDAEEAKNSGRYANAKSQFKQVLAVLNQRDKDAGLIGKFGGPMAGITLVELVDFVRHGIDHPLLDAVFGGVGGYIAGTQLAKFYSDSLTPMRVRAWRGLAETCFLLGQHTEARQAFAEALKAAPDDPVTRKKFADSL